MDSEQDTSSFVQVNGVQFRWNNDAQQLQPVHVDGGDHESARASTNAIETRRASRGDSDRTCRWCIDDASWNQFAQRPSRSHRFVLTDGSDAPVNMRPTAPVAVRPLMRAERVLYADNATRGWLVSCDLCSMVVFAANGQWCVRDWQLQQIQTRTLERRDAFDAAANACARSARARRLLSFDGEEKSVVIEQKQRSTSLSSVVRQGKSERSERSSSSSSSSSSSNSSSGNRAESVGDGLSPALPQMAALARALGADARLGPSSTLAQKQRALAAATLQNDQRARANALALLNVRDADVAVSASSAWSAQFGDAPMPDAFAQWWAKTGEPHAALVDLIAGAETGEQAADRLQQRLGNVFAPDVVQLLRRRLVEALRSPEFSDVHVESTLHS